MPRMNRERQPGLTILYDDVLEMVDEDTLAALVFGCVWRHERMRDGYCHASVETMADLIGVSVRTVQNKLKLLMERKLICRIGNAHGWTPHAYKVLYLPVTERRRGGVENVTV